LVHTLVFCTKLRKSRLINWSCGRSQGGIVPLAQAAFLMRIGSQVALVGPRAADQRPEQAIQPFLMVIEAAIELGGRSV